MRRRRSFVAGFAMVAIVLTRSTVGAAGPPEFDEYRTAYRLIANLDDSTICVDEQAAVDVRLHADLAGHLRGAGWVALPNAGPQDMPGALIDARAQGDVIQLQETERVTELHGAPGYKNAVFHFTGKKAGNSQITFESSVAVMDDLNWPGDHSVAPNSVDVKVINCQFVLHAFSTFLLEGPAQLTFGTAMTNVELTQGSDGQLRQSVTVSWFAWSAQVGDCFGQLNSPTSEAAVFGVLDDQGVLTVDVKYEPFAVQLAGNCGGFATQVTPSTLHFVADTRGDSGNMEQTLTSPLGAVPGAAAWAIIPTDDP